MGQTLWRDLYQALSPDALMRESGLEPDPWQVKFLRSRHRRVMLNVHRQSGKSTTTAFKVLHHAATRPRRLALVISPGQRQSGLLFDKIRDAYVGTDVQRRYPARKITERELHFKNGSRIISLPGKEETVRGFSAPSLIVIDEAARVSDALYYSLRPMLLMSDGQLILLSTPWGRRGFFFTAWHSSASWDRYLLRAEDNPRVNQAFLEAERSEAPEWWFAQEYGCEFREVSGAFFSEVAISRAFVDEDVTPLFVGDGRLPGRVLLPDAVTPLWGDSG